MSSSEELINSIPSHLVETAVVKPLTEGNGHITKALGLVWNSKSDKLSVDSNVTFDLQKSSFTKRELLSAIASIYDPLGLVSPIVIMPKIILQKLWLKKLGWDEKIPSDLLVEWLTVFQQLPEIPKISMPRCVLSLQPDTIIELHGFADSSSVAFGSCIYVRSIASSGIQTQLLCSKSRVAPLKMLSIPKLELQAALLLSRLINRVVKAFKLLNIVISDVFLWSDSTTVCSWITSIPDRKDVFVGNRVSEIQETTSQFKWAHVKGTCNPADIISRGSTPIDLANNKLWWHGPTWLGSIRDQRDSSLSHFVVSAISSVVLVNVVKESPISKLFVRVSNPIKLIRVVAHCFRFINNVRKVGKRRSGELSVLEVQQAEIHVLRTVQEESFGQELHYLRKKEELDMRSKIHSLSPFLHEDGLMRAPLPIQDNEEDSR